jgi:hypothetical protein
MQGALLRQKLAEDTSAAIRHFGIFKQEDRRRTPAGKSC